jgi:hypothetical protein
MTGERRLLGFDFGDWLMLVVARFVCHEGQVLDALAIYDGIAQSIGPNPAQSGRTRPREIQYLGKSQ